MQKAVISPLKVVISKSIMSHLKTVISTLKAVISTLKLRNITDAHTDNIPSSRAPVGAKKTVEFVIVIPVIRQQRINTLYHLVHVHVEVIQAVLLNPSQTK